MLNRAALIVRPAAPFIEWIKSLYGPEAVPSPSDEQTVYLVSPVSNAKQIDEMLAREYENVFIGELHAWHTDETDWPEELSLAMFREWFHIEIHTLVQDLDVEPLEDDDDDFLDEMLEDML